MASAPVLIVGAGPVGMTLALELARFDVPALMVDRKPAPDAVGSRAIVVAGHALEIFDRLGCGRPMVEKGVALTRARTYFRDIELFCLDFPPPAADEIPRFVNLQQIHTERFLRERVAATPAIEVRWGEHLDELPSEFDYVVACDGAGSTVRKLVGIELDGRTFRDRFLICDIRADLPFPHERRFYFDPPHNPGRQVLIHPQPDSEWRIDWQVPERADAEAERADGTLDRRIRRVIGEAPYEIAWLSSYRFHERVARAFRAGRVFLAGDAAHLFAPFGARGMNSGVEDAANLGWKLAYVLRSEAPAQLLDTYEAERRPAALENLRVTSATMRFMAPPTPVHRLVRNAILRGSLHSAALRRRVDSGRLAEPAVYAGSPPVGRRLPAAVPVEPAGTRGCGFADLDGARLPVRPDGYVADEATARLLGLR